MISVNDDNINMNNNITENKQKYNFKPELLKDFNKLPKSGGLNFEQNKHRNFNYFQFNFERNENNTDDLDNNDNNINNNNYNNANYIEKPYEYFKNTNEKEDILYNSDNNIVKEKNKNKNNKYSIEDSVKMNNFQNNINMVNNNYNNNNFEEIEKERRKQDLLQMINFSSNLKVNNNNNSPNEYIIQQNMQNNNDYENYNIVQSYEES